MIRLAVAARLLEVITAAVPSGVTVLDHIPTGGPNDQVPREWVGLGDITGDREWQSIKGGAQVPTVDAYDIAFGIESRTPGKSSYASRVRVAAIIATVDTALRTDPSLAGTVPGHQWCGPGRLEGPNAAPSEAEPTGWTARARLTIPCRSITAI